MFTRKHLLRWLRNGPLKLDSFFRVFKCTVTPVREIVIARFRILGCVIPKISPASPDPRPRRSDQPRPRSVSRIATLHKLLKDAAEDLARHICTFLFARKHMLRWLTTPL